MTLKNEIFEGIAAYKALTPTTQDQYYNEMYKIAKKKRQDDEKVDQAGATEIADAEARRAPTSIVPKVASTTTPGMPAVATSSGISQAMTPELPPVYQRGGRVANFKVRRFEQGGPVNSYADGGSIFEPDNPADMVIAGILRDPKADLGQFAPRRPPQQPVNPPPPVDPETAERIAAEGGSNTRARQGALATSPPPTVPTEQYGPNLPTEQYGPPPLSNRQAATVEAQARGRAEEAGRTEAAALATDRPPPPAGAAAAAQAPQAPQPQARAPGGPMGPGGEPQPPPLSPREQAMVEAQQRGRAEEQALTPTTPPVPGQPAPAPAVAAPGARPSTSDTGFEGSPVIGGAEGATSGIGRALSRDAALQQYKIEQEIRQLERDKLSATPSSFEATYPVERREAAAKTARIDQEIQAKKQELAALRGTDQAALAPGQTAPAQPGQTTPPAANKPPPPSGGAAPQQTAPGMGPSLQQMVVNRELNSREARAGMVGPNQVPPKTQPKTNGPATNGTNTAGGAPGAQAAPPRGASQPYTQQTAPKGSLGDQSRVAAYDPTADAADSRNVFAVDTTGASRQATGAPTQLQPNVPPYTNGDIQTTMAGAMTMAPKNGRAPVPGEGAASRPVLNAFVSAHNQGGKLEPGDALLVGMVGRYKELLRQGRQKEAATAAWGLIQAANLEAAVRGRTMLDQIKAGDNAGAMQTGSEALSYLPDGMQHKVGPDGKSFLTIDPRTGQVTGTTPMSGQLMLQLAMGLSDGSMLWQTLQTVAASLTPPDKDAGNRALRGQLLEEQIIGARQRNARAGQGGGKAPQVSGNASAADQILQGYGPQVAQTAPQRGSDSSGGYLSVDYVPPEPGQDNA